MDKLEAILEIVREKGPILPVQVSKVISDSLLMTSARLSELLSKKKIKISGLKVGGSPLYYFPGQEIKLADFSSNLGNMEKKAFDILSEKKMIKDSDQEPAIRVALRQIPDFAVPLKVSYNNQSQVFWKWYLLSTEDAHGVIKRILSGNSPIKKEESHVASKKVESENDALKPINSFKEPQKNNIKKEPQSKLQEGNLKSHPLKIHKEIKKQPKNNFHGKVQNFFNNNSINVTNTFISKKQTECDYIINLTTTIGNIKYFCRSKSKKRVSDSDLSSALVQAQSKSMPLLFLTDGDLTKKAREMLEKELKNAIVKKL
jgi:hypothetical protein